jgi:hypothetical protein
LTEKAGEQKPMIELLDEYIASLPPDVNRPSGEEVIRSLKEMEKQGSNPYFSVIESVADLFLLETEPKRRTILLHGAPNSGKTTFIRHMREIFDGYDHLSLNPNTPISPEPQNPFEVNLITMACEYFNHL